MFEKIKKNPRTLMAVLIVVCMGIIAFSEYRYLSTLQDRLESNELQHIMDLAQIEKQSIDDYIGADRERLHKCAESFSRTPASGSVQEKLKPFADTNAVDCGIVCFDEGLAFSTLSDETIQMTPSQLEEYRGLTGSGVRDKFTGVFSGEQRFSYYENFTFANGHHGLLQKSYDRSALSGLFSLSVYNGLGYGYLLDQDGGILCRSRAERDGGELRDNIFDVLTDLGCSREYADGLHSILSSDETGSDVLTVDSGSRYTYSYIPLENAPGWYLFSIVSLEAVETDVGKMMATIQMSLVTLLFLLVICGVLFMLTRNINREIAIKDRDIGAKDKELDTKSQALAAKDRDIAAKEKDLAARDRDLAARDRDLAARDRDLAARDRDLAARDRDLAAKDRELAAKDRELTVKDIDIEAKDKAIAEKTNRLEYEARMFETFVACLSGSSNDVYLILNEDQEVVYATPNLERVMHRSQEEIVAGLRGAEHFTNSEEFLGFMRQLRTLRPGESAGPVIREQVCTPTGERQYLLEQATCVRIQDLVKVVVYVSDRTREFKLRKDLADALRQAQDANNAKSAFLKSVSHDMRTPMNAIIGFLGLMRDEVNNPDMVMEYNQQIDTASQHLLGLINNVLDMSKIESGSMSLNISELNVAEIVEEIRTIVTPQVQAKNQTFDISVSQLMHEYLLGDKVRIKEILLNILSNAVKYTPEGGAIHLRVEELPQVVKNFSRIRFEIEDNGAGMSQDYQSGLFTSFSREDSQINLETQGSGLGLAIVKGLVDLMGGGIRVKSAPGKGSTFTVELDIRILDKDADPRFWREHKVRRMLIVDGDEAACRVIVNAMAKSGVSTGYAADGETALRMLTQQRETGEPYDLILLDCMTPDLDGLETARRIRKDCRDQTPVCLLTADNWSDIKQEAAEAGVDDFMPKPFFMSTFKDVVRRMMGRQRKAEGSDASGDVIRDKHVMIVDDIEINRIVLSKIMGSLGARCDTAANGREALEKFEASRPGEYDLILMDLQMPVLDGCGAARAIRVCDHPSAKSIPIIAVTANAFADDVRVALESGMNAHLAKPIQTDQLKSLLQQVLNG